jgi:hypothetical protein
MKKSILCLGSGIVGDDADAPLSALRTVESEYTSDAE